MKILNEYTLRKPEEDNGQLDNHHKPYSFSNSVFVKLGPFKNKLNPINVHDVNAEDGYWFNDEDTLVIELPKSETLAELMAFLISNFSVPQEFDFQSYSSKKLIRIWWD